MKNFLVSLTSELKTITGLKYVDIDYGQFTMENPPVQFPCALVTFNAQVTQVKVNSMLCNGTVIITVADMRFNNVNRSISDGYAFMDIVETIATHINDYTNGVVSRLKLQSIELQTSNPGFIVYELTFKTSFSLETYVPEPEPEPEPEPDNE